VNRTRWLVTGTVVLVGVLGGAALAAGGSSNPGSDFLGDVAERLGIGRDKLEGAIEDTAIARIDAAVAAGDLTKEEGEALKQRVRSGDLPPILPGLGGPGLDAGPVGPPGLFAPVPFPGTDLLDAAADYLGMDERDVREALRGGETLADLAKDRGKAVDGLKQAIREAVREDADRGVEDGVLTKEQADRLVEKLSGVVDELVEQRGGPGLKFDYRGPGPRFGPGPSEKGVLPGALPGPDLIKTALDYLDMDGADLHEAWRDGKSLADLAKARGKSVDGLKKALRDVIREDANRAVEDAVLTRKQADRLVEKFGNAVDELVEGSLRRGFDFNLRDGAGEFGLHFRIAPDRGVPSPDEQRDSSPEPPIALPSRGI
jgi:hypothetical protein